MSIIDPRIVLLGAGGSAMSAVTRLLCELGYTNLIAIDQNQSQLTDQLQDEGIKVVIGHGMIEIQPTDVVIASAATIGSHEWNQAQIYYQNDHVKTTPPLLMHKFLGEISKSMHTIAISGTHGKSSTTALAGKVFSQLDNHFGLAIVGAGLTEWGGMNYKINPTHRSDLKRITDRIFSRKAQGVEDIWKKYTFVIEADEYNKHMLFYDPDITLLTTLSHDHVDIYPTRQNYFEAFKAFALKTKKHLYGLETDSGYQHLLSLLPEPHSLQTSSLAIESFSFDYLLGGHNHGNATLVYQAAIDHGLDASKVCTAIQTFKGLWRRGEVIGTNTHGCTIISDYAHHPNELNSTYQALVEKYPNTLLHIIFQPHQAQRLLEFRDQAVDTLHEFTNPIVYQIYAAREDVPALLQQYDFQDTPIMDADSLGQHFASQCNALYLSQETEILTYINSIQTGVIVLFTAGNLDYLIRNSIKNSHSDHL